MTDDRRQRTPWVWTMFLTVAALLALRFAWHAITHLVDLVSTAGVLVVLGVVGWRVAVHGRRHP